jgi:integrase/recombinase XerD
MSTIAAFCSPVGPVITRYLALKIALGRHYTNEQAVFRSLDAFLIANNAADLSSELFWRWARTQEHLRSGVLRDRLRIVRNLCLYRRRTEPSCFVPDQMLFPSRHQYVRPYIFTGEQVGRLLAAASTLLTTRAYPLRSCVFRLAIVLLYTMGLRRGELLRLRVGDYDSQQQTLFIRASKFHKQRLLPLSEDGLRELEHYLTVRRAYRADLTSSSA